MPASRIDDRIMGNDRPGLLSELLRQTFWERRSSGWHATPVPGPRQPLRRRQAGRQCMPSLNWQGLISKRKTEENRICA